MELPCRRCLRQAPLAEWLPLRRQTMLPVVADGGVQAGYVTVYQHQRPRCHELVGVLTQRAGQPATAKV